MKKSYPLPEEYLIEIGRVMALSSHLEHQINLFIIKLLGVDDINDPRAFMLINHSSIQQKIDMINSLCDYLKDKHPHLFQYKSVTSSLRKAFDSRNRIAHCPIYPNDDNSMILIWKATSRGLLKIDSTPITPHEIRTVAKHIQSAQRDLANLVLNKNYELQDLF